MLVALLNGQRCRASIAQKGHEYICPGCKKVLILRKGRIVAHNFAHKSPVTCSWAKGETQHHLAAKDLVADEFENRKLKSEREFIVQGLHGDRRADVMIWTPKLGKQVAFELQHTPISLDEIEKRAFSYAKHGIAQIWIPFIRKLVWEKAIKKADGTMFVERYPARPFERWVHGFNLGKGMWMYDPEAKTFWLATLRKHMLFVPGGTFYQDGEEQYRDDDEKPSKAFKELTLEGPFSLDSLKISLFDRPAKKLSIYNWPSCDLAEFVKPTALAIST